MRLACIDIGTNTTRLLVAQPRAGRLHVVHEARAFVSLTPERGALGGPTIELVTRVVAAHLAAAREHGATAVETVATAGVRAAGDGEELVRAVGAQTGLALRVLSSEQEAALAFRGATAHLPARQESVAVVDVGGGSTEIAVGSPATGMRWWTSLPLGSANCVAPQQARERIAALGVPPCASAYAVGGGTLAALSRLVGGRLDRAGLERAQRLLDAGAGRALADDLDDERRALLPVAIMLLGAVADVLGVAPRVAAGGVREGVLLERLATSGRRA